MNELEKVTMRLLKNEYKSFYFDIDDDRLTSLIMAEYEKIRDNEEYLKYLKYAGSITSEIKRRMYYCDKTDTPINPLFEYLAGITTVNPLPAHYVCKRCNCIEWADDIALYGADLPEKLCPICGEKYKADGNDIRFGNIYDGYKSEIIVSRGEPINLYKSGIIKGCEIYGAVSDWPSYIRYSSYIDGYNVLDEKCDVNIEAADDGVLFKRDRETLDCCIIGVQFNYETQIFSDLGKYHKNRLFSEIELCSDWVQRFISSDIEIIENLLDEAVGYAIYAFQPATFTELVEAIAYQKMLFMKDGLGISYYKKRSGGPFKGLMFVDDVAAFLKKKGADERFIKEYQSVLSPFNNGTGVKPLFNCFASDKYLNEQKKSDSFERDIHRHFKYELDRLDIDDEEKRFLYSIRKFPEKHKCVLLALNLLRLLSCSKGALGLSSLTRAYGV